MSSYEFRQSAHVGCQNHPPGDRKRNIDGVETSLTDNLNEAAVVLPRTKKPIRVRLQTSVFADMSLNEVLNLVLAYRKEDPTMAEMYEDRLANVRLKRQHVLDRVGVEKGLSRSYQTYAELKSKARAAFRDARVVSSKGVPDAVSAGQITADNPDGKVFDFSGGVGIIDATAVEPSSSLPVDETAMTDSEDVIAVYQPETSTDAGKKRRSPRATKNPTPIQEPLGAIFGRPTDLRKLEWPIWMKRSA